MMRSCDDCCSKAKETDNMIHASKAILFCAVLVTNCFKDEASRVIDTPDTDSGNSLSVTKAPSRCGDWKPYKDQKCLKIATHAGHQTKEDAEIVCQAFSEGLTEESYPRLMTVKTKEEQEFLQFFLFHENDIVDNVWLGLQKIKNGQDFEWSDGTSVVYSNWYNQNITNDRHQCVKMASGEGIAAAELWVRVNCKKVGVVVCERMQTWTLEFLQNMILTYKLEQERNKEASDKEISLLKQRNEESHKEISLLKQRNEATDKEISLLKQQNEASEKKIVNLERNPVPIGFIYAELPNQEPPSSLWPQTKWTDVSSSYAGLFFRVVGGQAAPFGQIQEGNSSRLLLVLYTTPGPSDNPLTIPSDGSWSGYISSGKLESPLIRLQFRLSGAEVRPRNQAVKIWQRTQ